jgi:hypothetical protein
MLRHDRLIKQGYRRGLKADSSPISRNTVDSQRDPSYAGTAADLMGIGRVIADLEDRIPAPLSYAFKNRCLRPDHLMLVNPKLAAAVPRAQHAVPDGGVLPCELGSECGGGQARQGGPAGDDAWHER